MASDGHASGNPPRSRALEPRLGGGLRAIPYTRFTRIPPDAAPFLLVESFKVVLTVTTDGELSDDHEHRVHAVPAQAWDDYSGRILELEGYGYAKHGEEGANGRLVCALLRGRERITVTIERTG